MSRRSYAVNDENQPIIDACNSVANQLHNMSIGSRMAAIASAPTRSSNVAITGSSRRSVSITDSPIKRRTRTVSVNARPITRRVDFTLCEMLQPHTHDLPWLTNPEDYRCAQCGRYCSDTFLDDSKICGYCRGDFGNTSRKQ